MPIVTTKNVYHGRPCKNGHTLRYKSGSGCIVCMKEKERFRWRNDASYRARKRASYQPASRREYQLKKQYGLTLDDFNQRLAAQNFRCAICEVKTTQSKKTFHVDHDHTTGKVRDILCSKCNVAIGLCDDDPAQMEKAAAYLRRHGKG